MTPSRRNTPFSGAVSRPGRCRASSFAKARVMALSALSTVTPAQPRERICFWRSDSPHSSDECPDGSGKRCNDRDIRPAIHAVELEGAEPSTAPVCARHFWRFVKQRRADVAAEKYAVSLRLQELGNNGGSRVFPSEPVTAMMRHGQTAKNAHFRRKKRPRALPRRAPA